MNPPSPPPLPNAPPNPAPSNPPPNIVSNIPVRAPSASVAASFNDEAELDKIMQDVGHELKKEDNKPRQKGLFGFKAKPKSDPKLPQPPTLARSQPPPDPTHIAKAEPPAAAKAPLALVAAKPKPAKTNSAPVLVITLTVIVTGALIAAAYFAYKN